MEAPKSTTSFIEGLRASGNGSDATTLPTLISTLSKSSQVISDKPGLLWFWATGFSNPFRERAWSRLRKDLNSDACSLMPTTADSLLRRVLSRRGGRACLAGRYRATTARGDRWSGTWSGSRTAPRTAFSDGVVGRSRPPDRPPRPLWTSGCSRSARPPTREDLAAWRRGGTAPVLRPRRRHSPAPRPPSTRPALPL